MVDEFFRLKGESNRTIDEAEFYALLASPEKKILGVIYEPSVLTSKIEDSRWRVEDILFENVSFSRTTISRFEFTKCTFIDCLFTWGRISDCRFTACNFIKTNMHRCEFSGVYVNPLSFDDAVHDKKYSNIAVYLYQELLSNSRKETQPDFVDHALYMFRKWKAIHDVRQNRGRISRWRRYLSDAIFRLSIGYGVRLGNLTVTSLIVVCLATLANWQFQTELGLAKTGGGSLNFVDAFYFTIVVMTTLGFGDITPGEVFGKLAVSLQALTGFLLLATFASMIFRKISQ